MELFPFSYSEYMRFKEKENGVETVMDYLRNGGIPEYVKTGQPGILNALADDILMRDIAVRHAVRDVSSMRQLTTWAGVLRIRFSSICVGQINNFSITRIRENVTS
jgi:predicted AAA+ superfamily ATPase